MTSKKQVKSGHGHFTGANDPRRANGRPRGLKNKATQIREARELGNKEHYDDQAKKRGKKIIDRFYKAAEAGQPWAIQIFMEREFGKVKEFVEVTTPDTELTIKVVEVKQ